MKLLLFQGYDPILNDVISRIADYINTDSDEQPVVNGTTNDAELTVKQGVNVKGHSLCGARLHTAIVSFCGHQHKGSFCI